MTGISHFYSFLQVQAWVRTNEWKMISTFAFSLKWPLFIFDCSISYNFDWKERADLDGIQTRTVWASWPLGTNTAKPILFLTTGVKLRKYFDARFEVLSEFSTGRTIKDSNIFLWMLQICSFKLILCLNLCNKFVVFFLQLYYGKIRLIIFFKKMGQARPLFVYFRCFQTQNLQKNWRKALCGIELGSLE